MTKRCPKCNITKDVGEFYRNKQTKTGLSSYCKKCHYKINQQYRKTKKGKISSRKYDRTEKGKKTRQKYQKSPKYRSRVLESKYGITLEQYDEMFKNQNGVCAICNEINKNGRRLCVDHDHETEKVRALLCDRCNYLLGCVEESIIMLRSAINYLHDHSSLTSE